MLPQLNPFTQRLGEHAASLLRGRKKVRTGLLIVGLVLVLLAIGGFIFHGYVTNPELKNGVAIASTIVGVVAFALLSLVTDSYIPEAEETIGKRFQEIRQQRGDFETKASQEKETVFDTVQAGLGRLEEFYLINIQQAKSSYRLSVGAVILGTLTLVGGVWFFYFGDNQNLTLAVLSSIGGLVIEIIGATSFFLYRRSVSNLRYAFDRLLIMQDTMLAVSLSRELSTDAKERMFQKVIWSLIEARSSYVSDPEGNDKPVKPPPANNAVEGKTEAK